MHDTQLLIVGRHGPGGIGQYISEQRRHLAGEMRVDSHRSGAFSTDGLVAFVRSVLTILWYALTYTVRSPPDIVHVHSSHRFSFYRAGYYALYARCVWGCPVVFHVHGSSFDVFVSTTFWPVRRYQTLVFDAVDEIVVLSEYWKDTLGEHTDADKLTVIPNAVDVGDYTPAFDGGTPHVVSVSNQIPRKGVVELATAIDDLVDRDLDFRATIAGKGRLSRYAEELAATHEEVEYLGYVSEAKKQRLLGSGSIFVLPAYAEGLPIAMLEAMAAGNAIVATTVGAIPEVIREDNGLLVAPRDPDALGDALAELVAEPDRVAAMGERNRETAVDRYAWSTVTEELLATYEQHLDAGERGRP